MKQIRFLLVAAAVAISAASCSSSDKNDSGSNNTSNETPSNASADITAASGGELKVGGASLDVPAGALATDTTLTVASKTPAASLPDQDTLKGLLYDFGPDGTTFLKPVPLTLPLTATPGANEEAVISWLDTTTNTWVDLSTTTADGKVKADIQHFTQFIVRLKGVTSVDCSFSACEGDVVGTWDIQGGCFDTQDASNPFIDQCPTSTFDVALDVSGTITFTSGGTYSTSFNGTSSLTVTLPASCITALGQGSITSCDQVLGDSGDAGSDTTTCTGTPETGCTCTKSGAIDAKPSTGTYTKSGSQITLQDSDETAAEAETDDYCVDGNTLKVSVNGSDVKGVFTAKKQ